MWSCAGSAAQLRTAVDETQLACAGGAVGLLVGASVQQLDAGIGVGVRERDQFRLISQHINRLEER